MARIKENINYIFDAICHAGGETATRKKMKPAPVEQEEMNCFKRLKFNKGESFSIFKTSFKSFIIKLPFILTYFTRSGTQLFI